MGRGTRNDQPVDERVRRGSDHARARHRGHADHELYETRFRPALGFPGVPACVGAGRLSFFCLIPREDLALGQAIAATILLVVASGWRPRLTGVPHWWISYSFAVSATIPDGGDQVIQIL